MRHEERITKEESVVTYECDECHKTGLAWAGQVRDCKMCGNHICRTSSCSVYTDYNLHSGDFSGDYCDYYCKTCWTKGEPFINKIHEIKAKAEEDEEFLLEHWKKLCVNTEPEKPSDN